MYFGKKYRIREDADTKAIGDLLPLEQVKCNGIILIDSKNYQNQSGYNGVKYWFSYKNAHGEIQEASLPREKFEEYFELDNQV